MPRVKKPTAAETAAHHANLADCFVKLNQLFNAVHHSYKDYRSAAQGKTKLLVTYKEACRNFYDYCHNAREQYQYFFDQGQDDPLVLTKFIKGMSEEEVENFQ